MSSLVSKIVGHFADPEGQVVAPVGSVYESKADGSRWEKVTGTGNTGWVQGFAVDGSVAMTGDLDLGGNSLLNAELDSTAPGRVATVGTAGALEAGGELTDRTGASQTITDAWATTFNRNTTSSATITVDQNLTFEKLTLFAEAAFTLDKHASVTLTPTGPHSVAAGAVVALYRLAANSFLFIDPDRGTTDVAKEGTPVNNQLAIWTGDGTIEGDADLTYDGTTFLVDADLDLAENDLQLGIASAIRDDNGNELLTFGTTAGALNQIQIQNGAAGNPPVISASGEVNTNLQISAVGSGTVNLSHDLDMGSNDIITTGLVDGRDIGLTFTSGAGAPATTPNSVGDIYVDTTADVAYIATGTASSADWDQATGAGGGNVSNTGTPVDNQLAVWTNATTVEGTTGLTYDGTDLDVTGNIVPTGLVDGRDIGLTFTSGAGAPSSTPTAVGDVYVDTTADEAWLAVGTSGAIDWRQATGVAEVGNLGVPDANDDSAGTGGNGRFFEGDLWIDTPGFFGTPDFFVCTDDTATAANWEQLYTADVANLLFKPLEGSGAGAPGVAPSSRGYLYIDTTAEAAYVGVDTVASSDFERMLLFKDVLDEDTMSSDSATQPPSQQSVKAYVDNLNPTYRNPTGTTDTLVLADAFKSVYCSNASQVTVTIPTNASVAFPVGTRVNIVSGGAGGVTLTTTSLTLLPASANKTIAQGEAFFIEKAATDTWIIVGGTSA